MLEVPLSRSHVALGSFDWNDPNLRAMAQKWLRATSAERRDAETGIRQAPRDLRSRKGLGKPDQDVRVHRLGHATFDRFRHGNRR